QISFELCEQGQRLLPDLAARVLETVQLRSQPVRVTAEDVVDALLGMPNPFLLVTLGLLVQLALEEKLGNAFANRFQIARDESRTGLEHLLEQARQIGDLLLLDELHAFPR